VAGLSTVKVELVVVPASVVTLTGPLVAVAGTMAVIWPLETTAYPALTPLKATALVPVRLAPEIVTVVPGAPLDGLKLEIVGGGDEAAVTGAVAADWALLVPALFVAVTTARNLAARSAACRS